MNTPTSRRRHAGHGRPWGLIAAVAGFGAAVVAVVTIGVARHIGQFTAESLEVNQSAGGYDGGYPSPIVDHAEERREALRRYDLARDADR